MLWTRSDATVVAHSNNQFLIDRSKNTAVLVLNRDEALGLIEEIAKGFVVEGVPSEAYCDEIHLVIENPKLYVKDMD